MYQSFTKPILDFVLSLIGVLVLLPLFVLISLILIIATKESPFFIQERPGFKGKPFKILKFKTMDRGKDQSGELLPDDQRVTRIGAWLRKTSLDELPQLWNILIGDMSFIGPRPLLMHYLSLYTEEQKKRHLVRPGISGWAQINGRKTILWNKKFELDVWYVQNISFKLDMKIGIQTLRLLLSKERIRAISSEQMNRFEGENRS